MPAMRNGAKANRHFLHRKGHQEREQNERNEEADPIGRAGRCIGDHARPIADPEYSPSPMPAPKWPHWSARDPARGACETEWRWLLADATLKCSMGYKKSIHFMIDLSSYFSQVRSARLAGRQGINPK